MPDRVAGLLRLHAADPARIFLVTPDDEVTYAEQLRRSADVAAGLERSGVRRGARVHVQLPNCREFYDLWFGCALAGAVMVPTGPQSTADELGHVLADASPALSLRDPSEVDALRAGATGRYASHDAEAYGPDSVAAILYTSGTTSRAKGVLITDANYVAVGRAVSAHLGVRATDRWLIVLPLFHANAQFYCTMSALVAGASVALAPRFSASGWARQAATTGATLASLFAAPIRMVLASPPQAHDADNRLRTVLFAQNVSASDAEEFERRFGTRLLQLYGMTETVLPPTMNPDAAARRWDSIGRPLPGVRVDLLDESGAVVDGPGVGEMRVAGVPGTTLAAGYWGNAAATAEAFTAGGLRTGDRARRDGDGFLYFVDRTKDMIKRGGENVSAGEIERVAGEHPAVAEAAAIGVPDAVRDEAIVLITSLRPGASLSADDLIGWCAQRLSPFKVPSAVLFVDALPRTSVGKVHKALLRAVHDEQASQTSPLS